MNGFVYFHLFLPKKATQIIYIMRSYFHYIDQSIYKCKMKKSTTNVTIKIIQNI